jgi:hypothetical protein
MKTNLKTLLIFLALIGCSDKNYKTPLAPSSGSKEAKDNSATPSNQVQDTTGNGTSETNSKKTKEVEQTHIEKPEISKEFFEQTINTMLSVKRKILIESRVNYNLKKLNIPDEEAKDLAADITRIVTAKEIQKHINKYANGSSKVVLTSDGDLMGTKNSVVTLGKEEKEIEIKNNFVSKDQEYRVLVINGNEEKSEKIIEVILNQNIEDSQIINRLVSKALYSEKTIDLIEGPTQMNDAQRVTAIEKVLNSNLYEILTILATQIDPTTITVNTNRTFSICLDECPEEEEVSNLSKEELINKISSIITNFF